MNRWIFAARGDLGGSIIVAKEAQGAANVLATNSIEGVFLPFALKIAAIETPDTRHLALSRLSAADLPVIDTKAVATVRQSSEEFAEWRRAVGTAMVSIDSLRSDDEKWQQTARGILDAELGSVRERLTKSVRRSPALSSLRTGTRSLGYSALGAVVGSAAGGNPVAGVAGAAGAKAAEFVVDYIKAAKQRRSDRAVLDLALTFREPSE